MTLNRPRVQILLSTYNGAAYLDEQIESLINQKDVEVQILIRDDGSTDDTVAKLITLEQRYPKQIRLCPESNVGVIASFFDLIQRSSETFDYYAFCDQDDVWMPNKLARAVAQLREKDESQPLMYCSATQMVSQNLEHLKVWPADIPRPLSLYNALIENVCVGCTMVFNKQTLQLVRKKIPATLNNVIMHDWWIYLCTASFGEVVFDPEPSIWYRQHQNNVLGGSTDGLVSKWRKRLSRFVKGKNQYILSKQARQFVQLYGQYMPSQLYRDVDQFLDSYQKGVLSRMKYIGQSPFYRQSRLDNWIYKFVFILGKL
ncbi:glycosyltransferase family 2 protein [Paenibacillus polymyxa]|jgi:glycosyltransferase involved in cell wall biosynthesis|uniref:glycosyltransferase family 2 protein n=1 Tax=Paenibacillus polymyxa TaxID=1406 RepID=UPI001580956A|nr:glycosyltransferase family 2 protein [Paenibacillus polymyxa]MBY0022432.1 glycosyltransferase family 2 protein [Paenibacillus polymyxa]MBY0058275.1 glycosyltransferase family 2 protein [Paenibacillus polymyxa]MBY0068888.1 glycosyltransferase family 2 protein [Paenibacillus polymyxa]MBY0079455.1 glycosyltransferase family 2 protein [Paenibacillus polymyxa]MBZ6444047.1 glycosyltransferase family 2 protein [Paenibacillus polymyxa]